MKLAIILFLLAVNLTPYCYAEVSGNISVYTNRGDLVRNGSFNKWVQDFRKLYPSTSVKIVLVERYTEDMQARFEKRNYGDVVLVPTDMPKEAYPKFFLPLNSIGLSNQLYFNDSWSYEGKEYAYSQGVSAEGLIYNKALLAQVGFTEPPATLSDLYTACEKLKALGKTPIYLNIGAGWPLQQWDKATMVFADNGNYYEDMITSIDPFAKGKPYEQSLKIASTLFSKGCVEPDYVRDKWQDSKALFGKGEVAMFFLGSWAVPQLIEAGMSSRDVGFVPFPFDNSGQAKGILNFDWGIAINRNSKNKDTARAWVKFLLTQSNFSDVSGFIPTVKTRKSGMRQLSQYMETNPKIVQTAPYNKDFLRLANKAGMDFMGGSYIRNIILSPNFDTSMSYWNERWKKAQKNIQ